MRGQRSRVESLVLCVVTKPSLHDLKTCAMVIVECEDDRRRIATQALSFADGMSREIAKSFDALASTLESS